MATSNDSRHASPVGALLLAVVALGGAVGCNRGDQHPTSTPHGPHGGHTAVMSAGAGFELELAVDQNRRRMVLYVLQPDLAKPYPLPVDSLSGRFETEGQSLAVTFTAAPRVDDPEGQASRFALPLDQLPQQLLVSGRFVLNLSYEVEGQTVTASIPHDDDHGHKYRHD